MRIRHIYIAPGHNFFGRYGQSPLDHPTLELDRVECVAGSGLRGDRFFDYKPNYKGQVTFFAWETFEDLCRLLKVTDRSPAAFRRNIITEGVPLNQWIGQTFVIQGVTFRGTEEAKPCAWMDQAFAPGAHDALLHRGGLRAQILTSGWIAPKPRSCGNLPDNRLR